ncbi:MAG: protein kinase domain-containing protein, partial [Nannocystaceae bacterium]
MGAVFAAFDPELDRRIALKLLHTQHNFAQAEERLLREAQALAKLSHPNIVAVYDVGHHGSQVFMAMEFIRGQTLGSWMREHRGGTIQPVLDMLTMAGRGLAAAHASGMVHRDFKPENVLVGEDGRPRVVDFGLVALPLQAQHPSARSVSHVDLTATGAVMGTPAYMAPEQFLGATADARSDQFAYCVVLYESLYGHRPFAGDTFPVLSANVLAGRHRGFSRSQRHPRRLAQLIARGLATKPENRWPSMDELLRELSRESPWKRARNLALTSLAVGGALTIGIVGPWNQSVGACPDRERPFAKIWTPEIAGAVTASIQQTGAAYAATIAEKITTQLGHYQDQWTSVYRSTCDALDAEPLASNRVAQLACLDQRRREFSATVAVLHHADESLIAEATNAVAMLSPPEQCLDPRRASSFPKLPRDPTRAAAIIRLRGKLAEINFLWRTASFTKARTKLNEVEPSVVEVNDVFLTFETQIIRAELLGRSRQLDEATQLLTQVWRDALATNHDGIALTARLITAELNSARASAFPQTFAILEDVHALILRLGYDSPKGEVYARYLISLGHALERVSKRTEARPHLERALALVESLYPEGHPLATKVLSRIAILEMGSGNGALALEYGRSVVVRHEAALAPNHPQVAGALNNFAVIAREAKAFDEAINAQERAIHIWLANREDPRVDANVAMGYQNLAKTYLKIGDYEQARKAYRAELELRRKLEGERSWAVADLYANVASSY